MNSTSKPSTQRRHKSNSPPPKSNEEKEKTKKKSSSDDSKQRREDREDKKLDKPMFSRVFVRYPRDLSNQDLTAIFSKFGIVQDVQNATDRWSTNNSSTSTAFIKFSKASEAALASEELHGKTIRNKEDESKAQLNDSEKKNEKRENENGGKSNESEKRTTPLEVFVAPRSKDVSKRDYVPNNVVYNLMTRLFVAFDRRTSNGQLRAAFEKFGTVIRVFIICDRVSQASKGIGYVTYKKASEAAKALEEICDNFFPQFAFANKEINMNSVKQEKIEDPRDFNNNITHSNYSKQTHSSSLSRDNKRHESKRTIRDRRDSSVELENDEEYRKHRRENSLDRDRDRIHARNGNFSRSSNDDRYCEDNHHHRSVGRRSRSPLAAASQKKPSLSPKRSFCVQVQSDESDHRRIIVNENDSHGYTQMMVNSRRRYLDDILNKVNEDSPVLLIKTRIEEQLVKKLFDIVPGMVDFCVLCRADTTEQKSEYLVKYEDKHQTMYSLKKLDGLEVNNKRGEYVEIEYVTSRKRLQSKESTSACTSSPAALISERNDPRLVIMREELMKELIKEKHQKTPTTMTNEMKPEPTVINNNNNQPMVPNTINTPMMVPPPPPPPPPPMSFPAAAAAAAAAATAAAASFMPPPLAPAPASHPLIDPEHMQQTLSFFLYSSMLSQLQNSQNNANSSNGGLLMPKSQLQTPLLPAPVNLQPALLPPPNFPLPHGLINYSPAAAAVATPPQTQVDECKQNTYKRNNQPTNNSNNNNNSNKSVEKQNQQHQKKHITIQVNSRDEISKELLSVIMRQFNNLLSVHLNDDRRSGYAIFASEFDALLAIDTINNRHIANTLFTARIVDMDDLLVSRSSHHHTRGSSYEEADEDSDDDDNDDDDDDEEEKKLVIVETTTTTPVKQKEEKPKKKSSSSSSSSSKKKSTRRVHRLVSEPLPSPQQQKQQQSNKNNSSNNHMSVSQAYMNDLLAGYNITNDPSLCNNNNTNKRKASNEFAGGSTSSSQTTKKIQRNQN